MTAAASVALPSGDALIGGERVGAGPRLEHRDPSTGQVQGTLLLAGTAEVDAAVAAASAAAGGWRDLGGERRRDLLLRLADVLVAHAEELAAIRSRETGIPFRVPAPGLAVEWIRYYAGWADKLAGETVPVSGDAVDYTIPEPYGVVAALIPWNAPLDSIGMKLAPALAAGNTIVLKPSELAPFAALRFGELCLEAGLPPGVVNVVPGAGDTGAALVSHPGVGKITFTGGVATARRVLAAAAGNVTPTIVELGGKTANVVFPDADVTAAVTTAVWRGVVALSGQACVLPTRFLVHEDVYDRAVDEVVAQLGTVKVGRPDDDGVHMGPVITEAACERIIAVIERASASRSGRLVAGGHRLDGDLAGGYFVAPTAFVDVDPDSELATEEIFGPVLSVLRFRTEDEAVRLANGTRYGLGALVYTGDVGRAHRMARALEAGSIGVNAFPPMHPGAPFGGVKESGFGREGGQAGLREFLRPKNVHVAWGAP